MTHRFVTHLALQMPPRHPFRETPPARMPKRSYEGLVQPEETGAHHPLRLRNVAVQLAPPRRHLAVQSRQDPRGGPLVDIELRRAPLHVRHELHRRGPGANHRDALVGEVVALIPARRVKALACEPLEAGNCRFDWLTERPRRRDEYFRLPSVRRRGDNPPIQRRVPLRGQDFLPECNVSPQIKAAHAGTEVGPNFLLRRELSAPIGIGRKRKRVERRAHIARAARILIIAPGSTNLSAALKDYEVVNAARPELYRHREARKAAANNQDSGRTFTHRGPPIGRRPNRTRAR